MRAKVIRTIDAAQAIGGICNHSQQGAETTSMPRDMDQAGRMVFPIR